MGNIIKFLDGNNNQVFPVTTTTAVYDGSNNTLDTILDGIRSSFGTPVACSTAASMTDHTKIYIYTGSESGYTNGNWYYWNGSAWTSGGVYNAAAVDTDTTLTVSGMAADAKAVGDADAVLDGKIDELKADIDDCIPFQEYSLSYSTGTGKEVTKLYPVYGEFYRVVWSNVSNISALDFYEFKADGSNTRIKRITSDELPAYNEYLYTPTIQDINYLRIYTTHTNGIASTINVKIMPIKDYVTAADYTLSKEFAAVRKFTALGDSLVSGYYKESADGTAHGRNIDYSWPQIMARMYGQIAQNASESGVTCASWWQDEDGYCKSKVTADTLSQVYIMALGTNDYKTVPDSEITPAQIGSQNDINTSDYTQNTDSFWGNYAKILQYIHDIAPQAKIICCTIPQPRPNTLWKQTAIRGICSYSLFADYVALCDLEKWFNYLSNSRAMQAEMWQSHFTPVGYANSAEFLMYAFSKTIQTNRDMFINLPQIPYKTPITEVGVSDILTANANDAVDIISSNTQNIEVSGKYIEINGNIYFKMVLKYTNTVSSGRNNIFTNFPAPENTKTVFAEYDEGEQELSTYLSYTTGWRINGTHSIGDIRTLFGKYKKAT